MSSELLQHELGIAQLAAEAAAAEILRQYETFTAIPDAPASISTDADRQAQEIILQFLAERFPEDAYCAEESTPTLKDLRRTGRRLWIIDPIDGSRGFARKNGEFAVMIARAEAGEAVLGVVLEPARRRLTFAAQGLGCHRADAGNPPAACRVGGATSLDQASLVVSRSENASGEVRRLQPARVMQTYSAGIKLAMVARGEADLYSSRHHDFHSWDICAGAILMTEAGGRVVDARGRNIIYGLDGREAIDGVLAGNPRLVDDALARLRI